MNNNFYEDEEKKYSFLSNNYDQDSENYKNQIYNIFTDENPLNILSQETNNINDNDNNNVNFIFNENDNCNFIYNNSIINDKRDTGINIFSMTNDVSNKNFDKKIESYSSENMKESESNIKSLNILSQDNSKGNNIANISYKEKIFLITKNNGKKQKFPNIFITKRGRRRRKGINKKTQKKLRLYNIELKLKGILINAIFNHINKNLQGFKFKKLNYNIKRKPYEELINIKLKNILESISGKYSKNLDYNKKIIEIICKQKESELKEIFELKLFDAFYHILIEEIDSLAGLREEYEIIYKNQISSKKGQKYINGVEKVLSKFKNYLII